MRHRTRWLACFKGIVIRKGSYKWAKWRRYDKCSIFQSFYYIF